MKLLRGFVRSYSFVEAIYGADEKTKNDILSKAKALLLPSSGETFSYVALEAIASGTPPVVSTAVPEDVVKNGFNGFRIDSLNPVDYANTMEKLFRDEELWVKMSKTGAEFAKQFDYISIAKKYEEIIKRLLD